MLVIVLGAVLAGSLPAAARAQAGSDGHDHGDHDHAHTHGHHHNPDAPPGVDAPQVSPWTTGPATGGPTTLRELATPKAHLPLLLADFGDNPAKFPSSAIRDMFFQPGYPHGEGSVRDFYADMSGGAFTLAGQTSSWLRMPRSYSEYVGSNHGMQTSGTNARTLVSDAVTAADASIDFCAADGNGDAYVDSVGIVFAGPGASETGAGLWPLAWSLSTPVTTDDACADGKKAKVSGFFIVPERHAAEHLSAPGAPRGLATIGTAVHEFGHVLGLPDLYDTSFQTPGGVGTWDVMAYGTWGYGGGRPWRPAPLSAWSRMRLGWVAPQNLTADTGDIALPSADAGHSGTFTGVLKIAPGGSPNAQQYFLVERRTPEGWAADFPHGGLAVWRVDERSSCSGSCRRVDLVQADGLDQLGAAGASFARGDAGDLFPGSTGRKTAHDGTTPSLRVAGGTPSGITIDAVGANGSRFAAFLSPAPSEPPPAPTGVAARRTGGTVEVTWDALPASGTVEYRVYRSTGGGWTAVGSTGVSATSFVDSKPPSTATTYTVRAYNRLESGDSAPASVAALSSDVDEPSGGDLFSPAGVKLVRGRRLSGSAKSLAAVDGSAFRATSVRRRGKHRLDYRLKVPVPRDTARRATLVVDRNLRGTLFVKDGTRWIKAGRLKVSAAAPSTIDLPKVSSDGRVVLRIRSLGARSSTHKLNALWIGG